MDRNLIKLCWDAIRRHTTRDTECLELYQVLEILSKEMEELQAEVEGLKCCGNCEHYITVINEGRCFEGIKDIYRYDPNAKYASGDGLCSNWQKAGE